MQIKTFCYPVSVIQVAEDITYQRANEMMTHGATEEDSVNKHLSDGWFIAHQATYVANEVVMVTFILQKTDGIAYHITGDRLPDTARYP